jgi:glutathione S-transferase
VPQLELVIGNKNYSSWSMRPWVLLRQAGIPFREKLLKFNSAAWENEIGRYSPSGLVPVLMIDDEPAWDSLAIAETLAELFPQRQLWPVDEHARRVARSVCAELHAGFRALRSTMPMNIRASHPGKGQTPESKKDIDRVVAIWEFCRSRYGASGDLLFGGFSIADAMYAPVVMRFTTYAVPLPRVAERYTDAVRQLPAVAQWVAAALAEPEFVAEDEPYATP